jgi:acyl-CoA synthetase (AMP-forming)/AMP-acid ligase II/thioester reductase-like protein/acyl carrier protein
MPKCFNVISDIAAYWANVQPEKRAYTMLTPQGVEESTITYGEMYSKICNVSRILLQRKLNSRNVILLYPAGIEFIVNFLGCIHAGAVPAPVHPPKRNRANKKIADIVRSVNADAVLLPSSHLQDFRNILEREEAWPREVNFISTDDLDFPGFDKTTVLRETSGSNTAFLQFTSGSTSLPKGVKISHSNCLSNLEMIVSMSQATSSSVSVSWLPHHHDLGLVAHLLHSLYSGGHCVILSPTTFTSQPIQWLRAISNYGAAYTGAPNFAYQLCVDRIQISDRPTLDLSSLRMAINAAEPINPQTILNFSQAFEVSGFKPHMFLPAYGMAEATVYISSGSVDAPPVFKTVDWNTLNQDGVAKDVSNGCKEKTLVGCGHTWLDQQMFIFDPDTKCKLPQNHVGEIWVVGSNITPGYYNNQQATIETLISLEREKYDYLRTGDLGFIDEVGELYITGRLKDMIIMNGINYYPQDIEQYAEKSHPDLQQNSTIAFSTPGETGENLVLFIELTRSGMLKVKDANYVIELVDAISSSIGNNLDITLSEIVFLGAMKLPKTSSGKLRRKQAKQDFLDSNYDAVVKWPINKSVETLNGDPKNMNNSNSANVEKTFEIIASMSPIHLSVFNNLTQILIKKFQFKMADLDMEKSIFFYGIDSLKIIEIHAVLEERLGKEIPTEAFFHANTFTGMIDDIVRSISSENSIEASKKASLTNSSSLAVEIDNALEYLLRNYGSIKNANDRDKRNSNNTALLTGGSGFVGIYFLKELLDNTKLKIVCLIRAISSEEGLNRLENTAQIYNIKFPPEWKTRVEILIGDISKKKFGLKDYIYEEYSKRVDSIYHVAAADNFYLPFDIIKNTNVVGTIEVAAFALFNGIKAVHYISSCAVSLLEDCAQQPTLIGLVNGYAQSKYVNEAIALSLAEKGFPWVNYRLGYLYSLQVDNVDKNMSLHDLLESIGEAYEENDESIIVDDQDAFENLLCSMFEIGCVPEIDADFDLVPVEYAAKAIISISQLPPSEQKCNYTLYNPSPLRWSDVISYFKGSDKQIEIVPLAIFVERFNKYIRETDKKGIKLLKSVVSIELEEQLNKMFRNVDIDCADEYKHWCPPCKTEFTHSYVDFVLSGWHEEMVAS